MPCPLCGDAMREALAEVQDSQTGETFRILRCVRCRLGITVPSPGDVEPYYGERYYGGRHGITRRYCTWRRMRILKQVTRGALPGSLVDIGCGEGSFLLGARQAGWTVLGTEINTAIAPPGVEILGSLDELKARAPFGCVTLWHSLEHLRNPGETLADLAGMLGPAGMLILAVPDSRGWQARLFGRHWLHLDAPRHLYHFSLDSLRAALDQAGLEVTRVWHQEAEYDVLGWIQSSLNAMMPRPNILFDALTGRPRRVSRPCVLANVLLAGLLFLPAVAATAASAWARQGGTLVIASRLRG